MRLVAGRFAGASVALAGLFLVAQPTYAVDGVVLIDQAAVLAGGITPADGPGFPVNLSAPGSYRLSSDLVLPAGSYASGFWIDSDNVTLDLNGFSLIGAAPTISDGIFIFAANVEVRNGTVRAFGRHGVFARNAGKCFDCTDAEGVRILNVRAIGNGFNGIRIESQGALVDGCSAHTNGSIGILAYQGGLVKNSVARANVNVGFYGLSNTGFRSNVATANNGGDLNPQVSGGLNLGDNLCGTALCP
jgi:hypothetical protein